MDGEQVRHVLDDNVSRFKLANGSGHLSPQNGLGVSEPFAATGAADALAREPSGDDIDPLHPSGWRNPARASTARLVIPVRGPPGNRAFIAMCASGDLLSSFATGVGSNVTSGSDISHVGVNSDPRPSPSKDSPPPLIGLAEPCVTQSGLVQSVVEQPDAAEL